MSGYETTKDQPDFTGLVKVQYDWSFAIFYPMCKPAVISAPLPLDLGSNYQKKRLFTHLYLMLSKSTPKPDRDSSL
jgi:hypothetical protein